MEFAIQASLRGHTVDLYEKSDRLGGTFIAAAMPSFKEKDRDLIDWYRAEVKRHNITVHMNTEIKSLADIPADEYVIATGAKPRALPIPGWDKTINAADYLLSGCETGDRVAIIGGGITGCEVAYELALKGKHPFIVEVMDDLMKTPMVPAANSVLLRDLLKFHNVPVYLESKTTEIKDGSITVLTGGKGVDIPCDTVVVSVGYSAGTPLADAKKHPKNVHILGDADHVANLKNAIWSANDLVLKL